MDTNANNNFISRQISVYKTDKKLIEFIDKLNSAPFQTYAHMHAKAEDAGNGRKIYSNIGIVLQDYTNSKDENTIRVTANISPDEAQYIFNRVNAGVEKFEFNSDKIFGKADEKGYSKMTKLKIMRVSVDKDGKPRNCPWYIEIDNGRAVAEKNKTGGTYCKRDSFVSENKVYININDLDFFKLMNRVSSYIHLWESQYAAPSMITGRIKIDEMMYEMNGENQDAQAG